MHSGGLIFFLWGRGGRIQVKFLVGVVSNLVLKIGAHQYEEDTCQDQAQALVEMQCSSFAASGEITVSKSWSQIHAPICVRRNGFLATWITFLCFNLLVVLFGGGERGETVDQVWSLWSQPCLLAVFGFGVLRPWILMRGWKLWYKRSLHSRFCTLQAFCKCVERRSDLLLVVEPLADCRIGNPVWLVSTTSWLHQNN